MSLNDKKRLSEIAKIRCRENRNNPTGAEKIFWEAIRKREIKGFKFRRQQPIFFDITGRETFYIADFYQSQTKLIIEVDGLIHRKRMYEDKIRTEILEKLGYKVARFKNEEIETNLQEVIKEVERLLDLYA